MGDSKLDSTSAQPTRPLDRQEGGNHYKQLAIQPVEYCQRNELRSIESSVIRYVTRHRSKGGRQDILKAIHYLELLFEFDYSGPGRRLTSRPVWTIDPYRFCQANRLPCIESCVVILVTEHRWKYTSSDVKEAIRLLQLLLLMEYSDIEKAEASP